LTCFFPLVAGQILRKLRRVCPALNFSLFKLAAPRRSRGAGLWPLRIDPVAKPLDQSAIQVQEAVPPGGDSKGAQPLGHNSFQDFFDGGGRGSDFSDDDSRREIC
jgi:hypothetical protein